MTIPGKVWLLCTIALLGSLNLYQFVTYQAAAADEKKVVENFNKVFFKNDTFPVRPVARRADPPEPQTTFGFIRKSS